MWFLLEHGNQGAGKLLRATVAALCSDLQWSVSKYLAVVLVITCSSSFILSSVPSHCAATLLHATKTSQDHQLLPCCKSSAHVSFIYSTLNSLWPSLTLSSVNHLLWVFMRPHSPGPCPTTLATPAQAPDPLLNTNVFLFLE